MIGVKLIKTIKKKANLRYAMLTAVFAYSIPMLGGLMEDSWYKWAYMLGSHLIGLKIFLIVHKWYVDNEYRR
jgi:hypothetical protein